MAHVSSVMHCAAIASRQPRQAPDIDHQMMKHALVQARIGFHLGEVPVGAGVWTSSIALYNCAQSPEAEELPTYMQSWRSMTKLSAYPTTVWKKGKTRRRMPRCCACRRPHDPWARYCHFAWLACVISPVQYLKLAINIQCDIAGLDE